jgi:fibrillarin-like pre-rRNA processing protein
MVKIKPMRLQGVFTDEKRRLYTKSLAGKHQVYGERLVRQDGTVYREWDPRRSKLGAGIRVGLSQIAIRPDSTVLYLGAASGTTVSHVADIVGKDGFVYALDISKTTARMLMHAVVDHWPNVAPLLYNAALPGGYRHFVRGQADVVFQDIAQKSQVRIFFDNCKAYLKKGGFGLLSVKAKSIDVTKRSKAIFQDVERQLERRTTIVDKRILEPYEKDHILFVIKWNG